MPGESIRQKLARKLSMNDKEQHDYDNYDEADDETTGNLHRDIEESESGNHAEGKPGSFLNRLISHGNKKTEDQLAREEREAQASR
ncbi:hypothetical protein B9Z65_3599 [Elsinoe australis]|nr:hypothetical protein B9Z65_3599 [Elsinoe australis]